MNILQCEEALSLTLSRFTKYVTSVNIIPREFKNRDKKCKNENETVHAAIGGAATGYTGYTYHTYFWLGLQGGTWYLDTFFRLSVFSNIFVLHPHINVSSISHTTHQFHNTSARYNSFQWLSSCLHSSICTRNLGLKWGFCTQIRVYISLSEMSQSRTPWSSRHGSESPSVQVAVDDRRYVIELHAVPETNERIRVC